MKYLKIIIAAVPLLAGLLSGCTGPRPAPDAVDTKPFVALTEQAPCAGDGNRLFVVDNRYVVWDRGASCQDQALRLYGDGTDRLLCVHFNSPNGAYTNCSDPAVRSLFDTIVLNRQVADLGLGAGHSVRQVLGARPEAVNLVFRTVAQDAFSAIHTRRNVVIRDAASWAALWAEHNAERTPVPPLPSVDFSQQMLVGIFAGDLRGCHEFEIRRINVVRGRIVVEYEDRDITPTTICIAAITNPMHVVAIPKLDADVVFNQIEPARIEFVTIDRTPYSGVEEPVNVVIRDAAAWDYWWARHRGTSNPAPRFDFTTRMLVAVFRGVLPNGCYSTEITDVYRVASVINVARIDTEPAAGAVCTLTIVTPAHIISIPRSDDAVAFSAERVAVP